MKAKQIRLLAIATDKRHPLTPDLLTFKEAGVNFTQSTNCGIFAPKGTPPEVLAVVASAFEKALRDPETVKKLTDLGTDANFMAREAYAAFLKKEEADTREILDKMGLLKKR